MIYLVTFLDFCCRLTYSILYCTVLQSDFDGLSYNNFCCLGRHLISIDITVNHQVCHFESDFQKDRYFEHFLVNT